MRVVRFVRGTFETGLIELAGTGDRIGEAIERACEVLGGEADRRN